MNSKLEYLEDPTKLIDQRNAVEIVYLDFAKSLREVCWVLLSS